MLRRMFLPSMLVGVLASVLFLIFNVRIGSTASCPCSIWPSSATPSVVSVSNTTAVELGVKFRTDTAGYITGVRFYKASNNTGTHVGNLWTTSGTLLARATFTGETASGWQQVNFSQPVSVAANTTYVASYFAPNGNYSYNKNYFSSTGVDNSPLHALSNSSAGGNGVYRYGSSTVFPNSSYQSSNYWVDVVYSPSTPTAVSSLWPSNPTPANISVNNSSPIELGVKFKADTSGYIKSIRFYKSSANTGTHVGSLWKADGTLLSRVTFTNETASGWQQANFDTPVHVTPNAVYVASYFAPNGNYSYNSSYFASQSVSSGDLEALQEGVVGSNGVFKYAGTSAFPTDSYQATNYWVDVVFDTQPANASSPILVVTNSANRFSDYYAEILNNEGYTFDTASLDFITPSLLANYSVVVLGQTPLTSSQTTMLTDWVNAGGNLIAMRPDKQLASLAGLTAGTGILSNEYLKIATASGPGVGLVSQTIQFHGDADYYTLNGATSVAELFSSASTSTGKPAVSLRSVGANGGQVAVFTYDLAKSIVLTRQGNPDWAGQNRETYDDIIRSDDLFYPDWIDLSKVAIPQADEQQRLLGNLITQMDLDKAPVPHFWYLPGDNKAAVVMTADDHAFSDGGAQVMNRMNHYLDLDNYYNQLAGRSSCNVAKWECIRSSHYFYMNSPMTAAQAQNYSAKGFDLGIHVRVNGSSLVNGVPSGNTCGSFTPDSINSYLTQQLGTFVSRYPGVPAPATNRTHCIVWSDYASQPQAEANHGVRMDTNYYYWPSTWTNNVPGMMNGGGFPMRFADGNGNTIDTYQAMTQMQDEGSPSFQPYPDTTIALINNALSNGYYGVFTANMHTDITVNDSDTKSDAIITAAKDRGVPVVSARQMLEWIDGRNDSKITNLSWNGSVLNFNVTVADGATGLLNTLLPASSISGDLVSITSGGQPVSYTLETIKGIEYARFAVANGAYTATYGVDITAPTVTAITPTNGATVTDTNSQVKATFSEAMDPTTINTNTFELRDSTNAVVPATVSYDAGTLTAVLKPSQALRAGVTYTATVKDGLDDPRAKDVAGNALAATKTWSFTVQAVPATYSLWGSTTVPAVVDSTDPNGVELGIRFTSDIAGYIKGVRFYKAPTNTGTHIGNLWTASGAKLATATFTGETASGWQQVIFSTPVAINPNTAYIASYYAPSGHYSEGEGYFASAGWDKAPLHAPKDATGAHNGVYTYGSSAFPSSSWNATNYWVDVIFSTTP